MGKTCDAVFHKHLDIVKEARSKAYRNQKKAEDLVNQTSLKQEEISFKMQTKRHSLL